MSSRPLELETPRLVLRTPSRRDARALAGFLVRNWEFHRPWEPLRTAEYFTEAAQRRIIKRGVKDRAHVPVVLQVNGPGLRLGPGAPIIGTASLSNIVRGFLCSCFLGYRIDQQYARQGLMSEAVAALLGYAFDELRLHRVEANCMPENQASLGLLRKLGFADEGLSHRYLKIQGQWSDHRRMVMFSEQWQADK